MSNYNDSTLKFELEVLYEKEKNKYNKKITENYTDFLFMDTINFDKMEVLKEVIEKEYSAFTRRHKNRDNLQEHSFHITITSENGSIRVCHFRYSEYQKYDCRVYFKRIECAEQLERDRPLLKEDIWEYVKYCISHYYTSYYTM